MISCFFVRSAVTVSIELYILFYDWLINWFDSGWCKPVINLSSVFVLVCPKDFDNINI
jgi:hypothetical protein